MKLNVPLSKLELVERKTDPLQTIQMVCYYDTFCVHVSLKKMLAGICNYYYLRHLFISNFIKKAKKPSCTYRE